MKGSEARNRRIVVIVVIALLVVAAEAAVQDGQHDTARGESPAGAGAEQRRASGLNRLVGADEQPFGAKLPGRAYS